MSKHTILACLAAAVAVAGCTANMNAAVTPTVPGASASAAVGASATPPMGASMAPTTSASAAVAVSTGVADAAMLKIYKLGRKWVYTTTSGVGSATSTIDTAHEVVKVEGATATLKVTTTVMGKTSDSTSTVDLSNKDFTKTVSEQMASGDVKTSYTWQQTSAGNESVTVPAGTYASMKYTGKLIANQSTTSGSTSATGMTDLDTTFWTSDDVGLVKTEGKGKFDMSAATKKLRIQQMPDMSNIPGMSGTGMPDMAAMMSGDFTYTMVLKSVTL